MSRRPTVPRVRPQPPAKPAAPQPAGPRAKPAGNRARSAGAKSAHAGDGEVAPVTTLPPRRGCDGYEQAVDEQRRERSGRERTTVIDGLRRFGSRRRAGLRTLLIVVLVSLGVAAGVWALTSSPLFAVKRIEIEGAKRADTERLRAAGDVCLDVPQMRCDTGRLADRVRREPAVRDVRVARQWPNSLKVIVQERVPLAGIKLSQGGFDLMDGEGVVFGRSSSAPTGVPVLVVPPQDARTTRESARVLGALPQDLLGKVAELRAQSPDSVTLVLGDGRTVLWGSSEESPRKAQVLAALIGQKAKEIDVSAPDMPVTR